MPHPVLATLAIPAALILPAAIAAPTEAAGVAVAHHSHHWQHCHTRTRPCDKPTLPAKKAATSARTKVLRAARAAIGKPYIYGATGPRGYDCSGLVVAAYRAAGKRVPRTAGALARAGHAVTRARPGDVLVYAGAGHVAIVSAVTSGGKVAMTIVARHSGTRIAYQKPYAAYQVRALLA